MCTGRKSCSHHSAGHFQKWHFWKPPRSGSGHRSARTRHEQTRSFGVLEGLRNWPASPGTVWRRPRVDLGGCHTIRKHGQQILFCCGEHLQHCQHKPGDVGFLNPVNALGLMEVQGLGLEFRVHTVDGGNLAPS